MTVLITGGLGYIGSHTVVELMEQDEDCLIIDNLSKSTIDVLSRVESIVHKEVRFLEMDLLDIHALHTVFAHNEISAVIHFAGFKSVGESVANPLMYYQNNLISTLNLLEIMQTFDVKNLVFSSSATVYGDLHTPPLKEELSLSAPNPYGSTKLMLEQVLNDIAVADDSWRIALMRYFNPIGAHTSGELGEMPHGIPNNLMPHLLNAADGETDKLRIFGGDYDTADGSCVRDFIHIMDLAKGHVQALKYVKTHNGCEAFNLGTGIGYSVLDLIHTFEEVNNVRIPYEIVGRREGDIVTSVADVSKANRLLDWRTQYDLKDMCDATWKWYKANKKAYT